MLNTLAVQLAALISLLALALFIWVSLKVASARGKYGIKAPAISGHPDFERIMRVQVNTLEQLVPFLMGLWLCVLFLRPALIADALGALWLVGRLWFALGYYSAANRRGPGFTIALLATLALMVGALVGIILSF